MVTMELWGIENSLCGRGGRHDNLYIIELVVREKQKLIERQVLRAHRITEAKRGAPSVKARICRLIGERLISAGEVFKRYYQRHGPTRSLRGNER